MCQIFLSLPIPMFCPLLLINSLLLLLLNIQPATADPIDISGLLSQSANQRLNELRGKPSHLKKAAPQKSLIGARGDLADLQRVPFTFARGIDPRSVRRCQFPNGLLRPSATECEDELESESCASIFGTGEPRPTLCLNSELADLAKRCARTCRLCCESPKFNCVDSGAQLINCQEQRSKCKDPLWQRIMMAVCEHTCGLCSADQCFDQAPDCASLRSLCFNRPVSPLFRQQCPLTCGLCKPTAQNEENKKKLETNNGQLGEEGNKVGGGGGGDVIVLVKKKRPRCQDLSPSCEGNGHLCTDENYSTLFRDKCAKTCGHCRGEEGEEEEVTDMVKRIRHAKVAAAHAQRPMERPPAAANVPKKRRRRPSASSSFSRGRSGVASRMADRPIIIIDKRRMFIQQQREEEKERTEVEAEDGGDVLHISREILADQRTAAEQRKRRPAGIGPSPIVVFFGGGNVGEKKGRGGKKEGRKSGKSDREDGNDENDDNDEENNLNQVVLPDEEKATEDGDDSVEEKEADINAGQTIRGIREEGDDGEGATLPNEKTSKGNTTQNLQEEKGKEGNIEQKENASVKPSNSNEAALLVESILEEKAELNVVMNRSRNRKKNTENDQKGREEAGGGGAFDENTRLAAKRMSQQILDILQGLPKEQANANGGLELGKNDSHFVFGNRLKERRKREASSNSEKNNGRRPAESEDFRLGQQKKQPDKKMMEQLVEEILDSTDEVMSKSESSESGERGKSKWSFSPGRVEVKDDENEENDEDEEAMEATEEIGNFQGILQILGQPWNGEDESEEKVLEIEDGNERERAENDSSSSMESKEEEDDEESGSSEADEEEPEANPESLEVFEAAPKQPLLLDRLEEKEKAKASTIPGLKEEPPSSQFVGGMGGGGRKRPAIIRVRLRPKGGKQPLKKLLDKLAEEKAADRADQSGEMEEEEVEVEKEAKPAIVIGRNRRRPFDGILRDRQGNALRVEELPKGIGGALAEVRRRYGLGNWSDEEPAKALLETGQNISNGLTAILAELRAQKRTMPPPSPAIEDSPAIEENDELLKGRMRGRREGRETEEEGEDGKEVPKKKRRKSGGKAEREKRKKFKKLDDSELEEKETTKDDKEDEEEKMLKVLKKLLGVETAQKKPAHKGKQEKKTPKQAQLSANQLLEALRRMLQPTAQQPQQGKASDRLPNPTQPKVAAALLTDRASGNVRLVPVLRVPATAAGGGGQQQPATAQFIVTGGGGQQLQPNGQFPLQGMVAVLANGLAPHRQTRQQQPQIILTTGGGQPIQSQPAVFVQQPQQQPQLPQQMQPTTFVQPQQPPQQQIVYQVQPQQQQPSQVQAQTPVPQQPSFQVQQQPPQPQPQPAAFQPPIAVQDPPPQPRPQQRQLVVLPQSRFARGPFSLLRTSVGGTRAAPAPSSANCRDYYPYCEQIVPRGFCNSEFYPTRMKREFCPQSCNLC